MHYRLATLFTLLLLLSACGRVEQMQVGTRTWERRVTEQRFVQLEESGRYPPTDAVILSRTQRCEESTDTNSLGTPEVEETCYYTYRYTFNRWRDLHVFVTRGDSAEEPVWPAQATDPPVPHNPPQLGDRRMGNPEEIYRVELCRVPDSDAPSTCQQLAVPRDQWSKLKQHQWVDVHVGPFGGAITIVGLVP